MISFTPPLPFCAQLSEMSEYSRAESQALATLCRGTQGSVRAWLQRISPTYRGAFGVNETDSATDRESIAINFT